MKRIPEPADQTYDERIGRRNSCARLPATCMKDALRQIPAQQPDHRPQQETPSVMDIWEIVVVEYHALLCVSVGVSWDSSTDASPLDSCRNIPLPNS